MDPKMDSGYLAPGDTLEDDYDIKRDLLPEEVIGIIDQLICHEVSLSVHTLVPELIGNRWHGIRGIHYHRRFSQVCISSTSCSRNRRILKSRGLMDMPEAIRKSPWLIELCEPIV